ncbi:AMP-binding protein [Actinoplanes subtropicus]|uniref:AMP-binding protein n=1 Tax=Actinoplanes subtropicus TaxID=543632 RepID=UPI00068AAF25|nr:AMP-binding protein [Actinoplanes subtropicus]
MTDYGSFAPEVLTLERVLLTASRHPRGIALDTGSARLTYAEFAGAIGGCADRLARLRLPRQSRVGLVGDKVPSTYAWYLACWRQAHVVVPLNPENPVAANVEICRAAGVAAIVADPPAHPGLIASVRDAGVVVVDPADADPPSHRPGDEVRPGDLAYIMFTSGSTGRPKGVQITHGNLVAYLDEAVPRADAGPGARLSHTYALTFDPSVHDMFAAWTSGGTLVVPRGRELLSPAFYVRERGITHWYSVPSIVAYARRSGRLRPGSMPTLRYSMFVGEPLPLHLVADWVDAAPNTRIRNAYGPTELTVTCVEYELPADVTAWPATSNGTVPIGTVHPGADWFLLDGDKASAAEGELCLRGAQRFRGYLAPADNPGRFVRLTDGSAEVLMDEPGTVPEQWWYRTGDLVRVVDDGLLHLGRADRQVKLSGRRVELGEVEYQLASHPDIFDAAVLALPDGRDGLCLRAAVIGNPRPLEEMRTYLLRRMPRYKIPTTVIWLDSFPVNRNGKVDHLALRELLARAS